MPISSPLTQPIFMANLAANAIVGIYSPQLALAIATGLEVYANGGLLVQTIDAGTLGPGVGTGFGMNISPTVFIATFTASFAANGLIGVFSPSLITSLSSSFSIALQQALVSTVHPTVGTGSAVSRLIPNSSASVSAWTAGFIAAGLFGANTIQMVSAIAQGFDTAAPTAIGSVVISGSPSIIASSGVGIGKLS